MWDVLDAARTKWNFLPFEPGLAGGHCIPVDPHYLGDWAQGLGIEAQVVLAARATNDAMARWMADRIHQALAVVEADILVMGLTFKENVPDLRNSKIFDLIQRLRAHGHRVAVHDPWASAAEAELYGVELIPLARGAAFDAIVGAVGHAQFRTLRAEKLASMLRSGGLVADLKRIWPDARDGLPAGRRYWSI